MYFDFIFDKALPNTSVTCTDYSENNIKAVNDSGTSYICFDPSLYLSLFLFRLRLHKISEKLGGSHVIIRYAWLIDASELSSFECIMPCVLLTNVHVAVRFSLIHGYKAALRTTVNSATCSNT